MGKIRHSILFVDDDPMVLTGLKRSVEEYDDSWEADFAPSAKDALEILAKRNFDVVITDMHMPGMDGNQLLDIVQRDRPDIMRFVLSGNSSDDQSMKSTHYVHQMIPKPSDMEHVYHIVERALRLRDMLKEPQLVRLITGIHNLPSVPLIYNRLMRELQSEDASTQSVGNIIAQDPAMTAKILQLVNSAFFGLADNISSPQRAVTILGLNMTKALVLGIHVFSEYQGRSNLPVSIDALWKHSLTVSNLAYRISRDLGFNNRQQEDARISGILHDIGKLLLLKFPEFFHKVMVNKYGLIPVESEYSVLGTSHAEMGGYLLGMWGIPNPIVEAVTFHHRPNRQVVDKVDLVTALHIANGLLSISKFEKHYNNNNEYLDVMYINKLNINDRLEGWFDIAIGLAENLT